MMFCAISIATRGDTSALNAAAQKKAARLLAGHPDQTFQFFITL